MSSKTKQPIEFRCIDFTASDYKDDNFVIKMYGIDENRNTYFVKMNDFKPFLYIKVDDNWTDLTVNNFIKFLIDTDETKSLSRIFQEDVYEYKLVSHKTLYDFDANKSYKFIYISCNNMKPIYKLKSLYYDSKMQKLNRGVLFQDTYTRIYETMIPPLLRFFHIQNISPSGWVKINKYTKVSKKIRESHCDIEIQCKYQDVISTIEKETPVPYKICSFDIEASSSHGDFPNAIKNYKKVAYDIIDNMKYYEDHVEHNMNSYVKECLKCAFGFDDSGYIDKCYIKDDTYNEKSFNKDFKKFEKANVILEDMDENEL